MLVCRIYSTQVYKITPTCFPNGSVCLHPHYQCVRFLSVHNFPPLGIIRPSFVSFMGFSIYIFLIISEHTFMCISHMIVFVLFCFNPCLLVFCPFLKFGSFVLLMSIYSLYSLGINLISIIYVTDICIFFFYDVF